MKIVCDDKIPYIREALAAVADEVVYKKGSEIKAEDVKDADVLIVRTRTRCDAQLLKGSRVQLVATATIGYDHIDTTWLEQQGIKWVNCPGCNSGSVAQYVESVLILLIESGKLKMENDDYQTSTCESLVSNHKSQFSNLKSQITLGIVGCGHVGSKVCRVGERLGMRVLVNDPPLEKSQLSNLKSQIRFVSLDTIARECDVITFHVPLDATTHYLADEAFFAKLAKRPVIINSSRGGVVDEQALLRALDAGRVREAVIDTWENEPDIARALLNKVYIGTPHIAGYSADGKVNADNMVMEALCRHFGLPLPPPIVPPRLEHQPQAQTYTARALELYNAMEDSRKLKTHPELFEELRGDYPLRREKWE
ncbi:MAG: 4-phosphoerythronate dehydrogenase [Prevotella sp.]|nr:4-phosphoerythronate dehydrogenase [Prevotella sp.]